MIKMFANRKEVHITKATVKGVFNNFNNFSHQDIFIVHQSGYTLIELKNGRVPDFEDRYSKMKIKW